MQRNLKILPAPQPATRKHMILQACPVPLGVRHAPCHLGRLRGYATGGGSATCASPSRRSAGPPPLPLHAARGSEGGKRCKANFATLCLLSHNWHSRHAGVHSLLPSLASNRTASWRQLTQFNFQRTAREGRLVDWSTFPPELKLRAGQNLYRSPSHFENDQRVQGLVGNPFYQCAAHRYNRACNKVARIIG